MVYFVDKVPGIGTQAAQPATGTVIMTATRGNDFSYRLRFVFTGVSLATTDAGASGSSASLKIFTFKEGVVQLVGSRHDWTATVEGAGLTNAVQVIGFGSVAADAGDGALTGTEVNFGATRSITNSGGTGAGATTVTAAQTGLDGTATPVDLYLNWSATAATSNSSSTITVTGTADFIVVYLGDD